MTMKILIVGFGSIGRRHKELARKLFPDANICVFNRGNLYGKIHANITIVKSLDEAKKFSPDIVVVSNATSEHVSITLQLISTGAHFLIEKPISHSTQDVTRLIEEFRKANKVLMVGYNLRQLESLQKFREYVSQNKIGYPISVRCEVGKYLPSWRPSIDYRRSVSARNDLGGGVLLELSHEIDYLRWIFGEIKWVRASLFKQSVLEIDVEDTAHLVLGFKSEFMGRQLIANLSMDFIRRDTTRQCIVIGENGSLKWDGISGEVSIYLPNENKWKILFVDKKGIDETYLLEWIDFIRAIEDKKEPSVTGVDGLRVLETIEAARISSQTGIQKNVINSKLKGERK